MKKRLIFLFIISMFPLLVFARTTTSQDILDTIQTIQNVEVDNNTKIVQTSVSDNNILLNVEKDGVSLEKNIPYNVENNVITFDGGELYLQYNNSKLMFQKIENNEYSFYLYSILENMASSPYDISNYYNYDFFHTIEDRISDEDIKAVIEKKQAIKYIDQSKTFGLVLDVQSIQNNIVQFKIKYQYYLDSDYSIIDDRSIVEERIDDGTFKNPETGNFQTLVTIALMISVGLGIYSIFINDSKKKES